MASTTVARHFDESLQEPGSAEPTQREIYWREYNLHVELYKHHMDMALKANLFFYLMLGSILTYYFQNVGKYGVIIQRAMILPALMSFTFCGGFVYAGLLAKGRREKIFDLNGKLGLNSAPNINLLQYLLWAFAVLFLGTGIGMLYLVFRQPAVNPLRVDQFCVPISQCRSSHWNSPTPRRG